MPPDVSPVSPLANALFILGLALSAARLLLYISRNAGDDSHRSPWD